jgi:hypothetical protein
MPARLLLIESRHNVGLTALLPLPPNSGYERVFKNDATTTCDIVLLTVAM